MRGTARPAREADKSAILALLAGKVYPQSVLELHSPEVRRADDVLGLEAQWETVMGLEVFQLWVVETDEIQAFALVLCGQSDHATGILESVVLAHAGSEKFYPILLAEAARHSQARGDRFLAIRCYPDQSGLQQILEQAGLAPEFSRVVRDLKVEIPWTSELTVRPAQASDRAFLARLHVECSSFYRSSHRREADWDTLEALNHYLALDFSQGEVLGWVAESNSVAVGYVLVKSDFPLEFPGLRAAYLYDIAVLAQSQGKQAASVLHERAVQSLRQSGYDVLIGDISWHNHRALAIALEKLGYQMEWQRWGLNL